jgi:hypothetical protein
MDKKAKTILGIAAIGLIITGLIVYYKNKTSQPVASIPVANETKNTDTNQANEVQGSAINQLMQPQTSVNAAVAVDTKPITISSRIKDMLKNKLNQTPNGQ